MKRGKRICDNSTHPFKQKWYWYNPDLSDPQYCASCEFAIRTTTMLMAVTVQSKRTLYGNEEIILSREHLHGLLDAAYDHLRESSV